MALIVLMGFWGNHADLQRASGIADGTATTATAERFTVLFYPVAGQ